MNMDVNPENVGFAFFEMTKFQSQGVPSDMALGAGIPSPEYHHPGSGPSVSLPEPDLTLLDAKAFSGILRDRRSRRAYSREPCSLTELSLLLYATQGVQEKAPFYHLRTVPSAGARHPLETYLCINRVENIPGGFYHYLPFSHKLETVRIDGDAGEKLRLACLGQNIVSDSSVDFIWSAVFYRSGWKYKQRGFRYILLDAGHVCQNLYLASEALGLGCCGLAAFDDDTCNGLLEIDGKEQFCLYMAGVGKRR